jgi:hypothetical protein
VPEVLLADIVDSVVLFDKTGELALLKDRLKTYPLQMKRVILASSSHELSVKARMLAQAGASDDSLWVSCIIGSLLQPLLRGLFARHGVYFRGMKHLTCQIVHHIPNELGLVRRLGTTNCQNLEETVAVLDSLSVELHRISIS